MGAGLYPAALSIIRRHRRLITLSLYVYVLSVLCPIRYWPLQANIDQTWRFALNYAHAHGLTPGTEVVFTSGPLGYLTFPEHFGSNLGQALLFQTALWLLLALVVGDLFFRQHFPLRNLALFSLLLGMSADLFWFDFLGLENLLLVAAIIMLLLYERRGGMVRYLLAAALIGMLPFIKLTAGMMGFGALLGFLTARLLALRLKAWPEVLIAVLVPTAVGAVISVATIPSRTALLDYLRGSFEVTAGFSSAMATPGSPVQMAAALLVVVVFGIMLSLVGPKTVRFYALLLAIPLFVSFKQGFVRQDRQHTGFFFCFIAFALAIISLNLLLSNINARRIIILLACFSLLWITNLQSLPRAAAESSGLRGIWMAARAFPLSRLEEHLDSASAAPSRPCLFNSPICRRRIFRFNSTQSSSCMPPSRRTWINWMPIGSTTKGPASSFLMATASMFVTFGHRHLPCGWKSTAGTTRVSWAAATSFWKDDPRLAFHLFIPVLPST